MQALGSRWHELDLEHDLGQRDPPGAMGCITIEQTSGVVMKMGKRMNKAAEAEAAKIAAAGGIRWQTKERPIGRALVASHQLIDTDCQCRHGLR